MCFLARGNPFVEFEAALSELTQQSLLRQPANQAQGSVGGQAASCNQLGERQGALTQSGGNQVLPYTVECRPQIQAARARAGFLLGRRDGRGGLFQKRTNLAGVQTSAGSPQEDS